MSNYGKVCLCIRIVRINAYSLTHYTVARCCYKLAKQIDHGIKTLQVTSGNLLFTVKKNCSYNSC